MLKIYYFFRSVYFASSIREKISKVMDILKGMEVKISIIIIECKLLKRVSVCLI